MDNWFKKEEFVDSKGKRIVYRIFVPNLEKDKKYPLFIWMHGYGERGDDNIAHIAGAYGEYVERVRRIYNDNIIILAPQCPGNEDCWYFKTDDRSYDADSFKVTPALNAAKELIEKTLKDYPISKTSAAGFSMGGGGVILLSLIMKNTFTKVIAMGPGMVPIKGDIDVFKRTKLILTCAFNDNIVSSKSTRNFMNYLCEKNIPFSFYQSGNGDHFEAFIYAATSEDTIKDLYDEVRY